MTDLRPDTRRRERTDTRRPGYADLPRLIGRLLGDPKHERAAGSTLDILWVLYDRILDVAPDRLDDPQRDRFLLSKGHGPSAYYAVLAAQGFFPEQELDTFGRFGSILGMHPDRTLVPGVEISSGSLGHGLPLAVGRRSACAPSRSAPAWWCWSATASWTRAATMRRSRSRRPAGWAR